MSHERVQENIPAFVLGALDAEEATAMREHVSTCPTCSAELAKYAPVAAAMNEAVEEVDLPPGFTDRLVRRATGRAAAGQVPEQPRPRRSSRLPWALAAASVILAIGFGAWGLRLSADLSHAETELAQATRELAEVRQSDARVATLLARRQVLSTSLQPEVGGVQGRVYVAPERNAALLVMADLPPLPADRVYQLWFRAPGDQVVSGGTFTPIQDGSARLYVTPSRGLSGYVGLGVTVEPRGGSPGPTTSPLVTGEL